PVAVFATARRCGWIVPGDGAERYRLSAAGIKALRQARCGQTKAAAQARSPSRQAPAPPTVHRALPGTRASREGSLAWLRQRRDKDGQPLVTQPQFDAGERLAADYWHAQLMPRVTADWSAAAGNRRTRRAAPGAGVELGDNVVAARQRVARALTAVGPELAGILVDVCCHEVGLATAERAHGLPQRSGKVVLQLALTSLARHYGIITAPSPMAARMRHWGTGDYRPDIEAWR